MKRILLTLFVTAIVIGCSVKPEPLHFSKDDCHFCKMTLMDDKFGGELVTKKGKVFKFDDIKCMVAFLHSSEGKLNEYAFELVVDYAHKANEIDLIKASDSFYFESDNLKSPMGGNIAAFKNQEICNTQAQEVNGKTLTWSEVKEMFK